MTDVTTEYAENHTSSLVWAWGILIALTLLSWWASDHGLGPAAATTAILVITFVKVFMVGHSFMELRRAPLVLQISFAAWCAGTCALLVALAFVL